MILNQIVDDLCLIFIYRIVEDNCDITVVARHQTTSNCNRSFNWAFHFAVKSRLSRDPKLDYESPQGKIKDLDLTKLLAGKSTMNCFKQSFPHLVARTIVKYMPIFAVFKSVVTYHLAHEFSQHMAEKSEQVIIFVGTKFFIHLILQNWCLKYRMQYHANVFLSPLQYIYSRSLLLISLEEFFKESATAVGKKFILMFGQHLCLLSYWIYKVFMQLFRFC